MNVSQLSLLSEKEDKVEIKMKFINLTIFACVQLRSTKKNGACVFLGADFSKSFGGKISHILTDFSYRLNKKLAHAQLKVPVFFLSFLAGKLKIFKQSMPWILGRQIKFQSPTKSRHTICSRLASSRRLWWVSLS